MTTTDFFGSLKPVRFEGPESSNPFSYRHYDPDTVVLGKRMEDHLRPAVCYWHSFVWNGLDPFGMPTIDRPWFGPGLDKAQLKADVAFDMLEILGFPFFTFHDWDIAPYGNSFAEFCANVQEMAGYLKSKMRSSRRKLLWGTANLFSHPRYMAGAATNPDPDVFAVAAAQVKNAIDVTHELKGANYVLWGGREGYETLLNTRIGQELDQLARFISMVVDYKHKIGFRGTILVEPKPQEPTKHQYDFDVSTVYGFLKRYGLEGEVKVNVEVGHAFLANHSFEHEIAMAAALGILGSMDINRNDVQSGWDTDQFPNNAPDLAIAFYHLLQAGGFKTGGLNFDAKIRRQSIDPEDLIAAHVGGIDTCAHALKIAAAIIEDGGLDRFVDERYAGWRGREGRAILAGKRSLDDLAARVARAAIDPAPKSGRQEYLENLIARYT
jgi:xylose isomerase